MLLAVTSNPTIDRTLFVPRLTPGRVHRARAVHCAAGGKGLNVARAARVLGAAVTVTGPLGGHTGRQVADLAQEEGLQADWYWRQEGETRNCILVNHEDLDATVINEPGSNIAESDWRRFEEHLVGLARDATAIAFSGSQPPGIGRDAVAGLARRLSSRRRPVYLDTSGSALEAVLREPSGLCLKVNGREFLEGLGDASPPTLERVAAAGRDLAGRGAALVMVTLGERGAIAVRGDRAWSVKAPSVEVVSTVGSGDSFLAGFIVASLRGRGMTEALVEAASCGAANATTSLPGRFPAALVQSLRERVELHEIPCGP